jgi:carnitine O-acetyltransferase
LLPRLPLPDIASTLDAFVASLEPLGMSIDEEVLAKVRGAREEGERLQARLAAAGERAPSWLEPLWDAAYLEGRDPIALHVNYAFVFAASALPAVGQTRLAAHLIRGALAFRRDVVAGTLAPDRERDAPLCMSQVVRLFNTGRFAREDRDELVCYQSTPMGRQPGCNTARYEDVGSDRELRSVVVLAQGRVFLLDCSAENPTVSSIEQALAEALASPAGPSPGVITSLPRDELADAEARFVPPEVLVAIAKSALVVSLDSSSPQSDAELARLMLHGTGQDRWFDKHQLIVTANGKAGMNFEHAVGDGTTTLRLADEMVRFAAYDAARATPDSSRAPAPLRELHLNLPPSLIASAFDHFHSLVEPNQTHTVRVDAFGGRFIKAAKCSPDALVQVALQLAFHSTHGRLPVTYESASTRRFLHGRTETVRSATFAAATFCSSVREARAPLAEAAPRLLSLLRAACDAHSRNMKDAKAGAGCDRHLFGLASVANPTTEPAFTSFFAQPAYAASSHWELSSSHCGSASLDFFGFGPVVKDGFGVGYMIKNDTINLQVTTRALPDAPHHTAVAFATAIHTALLSIQQIVLIAAPLPTHVPSALEFSHPTVAPVARAPKRAAPLAPTGARLRVSRRRRPLGHGRLGQ